MNQKQKHIPSRAAKCAAILLGCAMFFSAAAVESLAVANADHSAAAQAKINEGNQELQSYISTLPFTMPEMHVPEFPDKQFNITDYGAVGDGITKNTDAFAAAISACAEAGGGTVLVPSGEWLTGPITLKSNVNLHMDAGAVIDFSKDHKDYPLAGSKPVPLIYGTNLTHVGITGEGVINGSGDTWRPVKKDKLPESRWNALVASGGKVEKDIWYPPQQVTDGKAKDVRPYMVDIENSKSVLIDGPTLDNSPMFNLNIKHGQDVIIRHTKVMNEWYDQNTDGIDVNGKNIVIYSNIVSTGDDGICMKSSGGGKEGEPGLENVVIEDNIVNHAHGGFVVGSNTDGGMKNIYVHNNVFSGTDTGLRFKSATGIGGLVQDIWIDGITMKNIATDAITFDVTYPTGNNSKLDTSKVPQFQNIHLNHIVVDGAQKAVAIKGTEGVPVGGVDIQNSVIQADTGFTAQYASGIRMTNVSIMPKAGPLFTLHNSDHVSLDTILYPAGTDTFLKLDGEKTQNIQIKNIDTSLVAHPIDAGNEVPNDAVNGAT